jgi:hypothetical protein
MTADEKIAKIAEALELVQAKPGSAPDLALIISSLRKS